MIRATIEGMLTNEPAAESMSGWMHAGGGRVCVGGADVGDGGRAAAVGRPELEPGTGGGHAEACTAAHAAPPLHARRP